MSGRDSAGFMRHRELNRFNAIIQNITSTLSQTADDDSNMPVLLGLLGCAHNERFKILGEPNDIDKAIDCLAIIITLIPENDPILPSLFNDLGICHRRRFQRLGEADDSDRAIECLSLALASTPDGYPSLPELLANLGSCYVGRFERLGHLDDLEKAIEYESRVLKLTPDDHPILPDGLANLGISLKIRFEHLGALGDLGKAIEYESRALALTPNGHPQMPARLANLGVSYSYRFERLGGLGDLDKAIEYKSRAVALTPDDHPALPLRLTNLGVSYGNRYQHLGELGDLDKAIACQFRSVVLTPDDHPDLSARLANLGLALKIRYRHLGELDDLEKAIHYQSRAVALTPDGNPRLPDRLDNLGVSHRNRFEHLGELVDLEKAIEYETRSVILTPTGHPQLPDRLGNLGTAFENRFQGRGQIGDLEKAIEYKSRALALTPDDHPLFADRLYNLGISHRDRLRRLHHQEDLEKAIECISCAIELTPRAHPSFPDKHCSFAGCRFLQYQQTGDPSDLQDSLHSYRMATQSLAGSPRNKFKYAIEWAKCASVNSSLNCIEAYQKAIDLLPQFIWLGATTIQRYEDLTSVDNLAADAALAAILASDYTLALEWLEHARCVVWNQSLMLRTPLDKLRSHNPALASRLQTIATQLHQAGSESRQSQALVSGSLGVEQAAQQHHQLTQEYSNLISHVRTLPGSRDFLRPIKANSLVRAARSGPIIVINCHESRCDALVIVPGQVQVAHIPLSNFSDKKARVTRLGMGKLVRDSRWRERGVERRPVLEEGFEFQNVLASLWYDVVKPVLDFLGYTNNVSCGSLPHITWCPTSALSFLPLHAAGDYNHAESRIYNYAISSYAPTLTALLSSTPSSLSSDSRVLAIGQPHTPGHSSLPGTTEELAYLKDHISGRAEYSELMNDQATTTAVLDAMEQHDWVHLACHAHQNVSDPTKSGFFLHDGALDLASINRRSFKNKGLAYLSACQTATGDEKLPDEAIHLASGMLMAGYSSVIATMWSVMDADAPFVANKVYEQLMKEGTIGNGETGKALHYAVAKLREKVGEQEFGRWVPYIHIGS